MEVITKAYEIFLTAAVVILVLSALASIIRSVLGPGLTDRVIAVNMIGTMVIMIIAILSVFLDESYLVDICLIYALISFLAVVVLCKIYTGTYLKKHHRKTCINAIELNLLEQERKAGKEEAE